MMTLLFALFLFGGFQAGPSLPDCHPDIPGNPDPCPAQYGPNYNLLTDDAKYPMTFHNDYIRGYTDRMTKLQKAGLDVNEDGIVAALYDPMLRDDAESLMISSKNNRLKVNLVTPRTMAALRDVYKTAMREYVPKIPPNMPNVQAPLPSSQRTLASLGDTTWVDDIIALLPHLIYPYTAANDLASVGRGEGWPYIRASLSGNNTETALRQLDYIEKFDGLRNPDGGQPIDVARELHQIAATTPRTARNAIEAKAAEIEKRKQSRSR